MDPVAMVALFAVVGGGIVALAYYFARGARIRRALRKAPRCRIADAPEGQVVRLDGRVVPGETLIAPLTGRPCVFYEALIEQYHSSGKSGSWRTHVREVRGVPFALDDGSGRAIIDPRIAHVDCQLDSTTRSGTLDDPTPVEQAFLARHAMSGQGFIFNKSLRYREGALEVGEQVAVMGTAVREPDPDAVHQARGYRDALATRLRLGGAADHPILISDARDL